MSDEPEVERFGDDYWCVIDWGRGGNTLGTFRTEAEALAFWQTCDDRIRRDIAVVGYAFDTLPVDAKNAPPA